MRRRRFLYTSLAVGLTAAIAGCNTGNDGSENSTTTPTDTPGDTQTPQDTEAATETDEQQTTEGTETAVIYFFDDETGAIGHLGDEEISEGADTITNSTTESEYDEIQRNDVASPKTPPPTKCLHRAKDST